MLNTNTSENSPNLPPNSQARLSQLASTIQKIRANLIYVDYKQAERDCELLATNILGLYSLDDLRTFSFVAIPRGGLIVLGILSYILDLQPAQLQPDLATSRPLVIVDDCALSGTRFSTTLAKTDSQHVVFAHLYSPPGVRQAIVQQESQVQHCITAHDLHDSTPQRHHNPAEYQAWQKRWRERFEGDRYWFGQTQLVCFAWSEPTFLFWNPATERVENGWDFLPPHQCLKNKTKLGLPPKGITADTWQLPLSVVTGWFDGTLWLCQNETNQVYALQGSAAEMWRAVVRYGDLHVAASYLLGQYEVDEATLHSDLTQFVTELRSAKLLQYNG